MSDQAIKVTTMVLAAGMSRRMGKTNKLLEPVRKKPMVAHVISAALNSASHNTIVITGHQQKEVKQVANCSDAEYLFNPDFATGMASSIVAGVTAAKTADAVLVLLGDMPEITSAMIDQLIETYQRSADAAIIVSTCNGKRGNPLLWPSCYFEELMMLKGDTGAKQILSRHQANIVEVELGQAAALDFDTPQAFKSAACP